MKLYIYIFTLFFIFSCKNDNEIETLSNKELIGNWIWKKSIGGIGGTTETPESTGKTIKLVISNEVVKIYENGNLISENNYNLQIKESIQGGNKPMLIYSSYKPSQNYQINGNKLYLNDECYDCYNSEYEKE